ncbi:hypothetical protein [Anabaena sp. CCY 0017]|uniref:hypothetical protein n=1 Tax=Anabaena sp. CCY 0017 TaxID=3103866 RepID=UPI0039C71066
MAEDPKDQNTLLNLEGFWKLLDSKLVSLGIPGALIGVALDFARKTDWKNAGLCILAAGGIWLVIKVGSKLSPQIDKFLDWLLATQIPKWWTTLTDRFGAEYLAGLNNGKCLVMLDGLDEIGDDEERRKVSNWVSQQLRGYKQKLPFILTSRPQAYNQAPLPDTPAYFVRSFTTAQNQL